MPKKFVIVNNGLRDHCGHHYETSIALAEAARRNGLHPVLATHVDCPAELLPGWLECYPIFCTDHAMADGPFEPPDLGSVSTDPYAGPHVAIEAVQRRDATVRDFVTSRFGEVRSEAPRQAEPLATGYGSRNVVGRALRTYHQAIRIAEPCAFYVLPPCLFELARWLARWLIPPVLCPSHHPELIGRLRELAAEWRHRPKECEPASVAQPPQATRRNAHRDEEDLILDWLARWEDPELGRQIDYALIFKRDLERLLALAGATHGDHIVLATAHVREVFAVQHVVQRLGPARSPTFHLGFRQPLFPAEAADHELDGSPAVRLHRAFFELYENGGASDRIRFHADTEELARDYQRLCRLPFTVMPIPFGNEHNPDAFVEAMGQVGSEDGIYRCAA